MKKSISVELFFTAGCSKCAGARDVLRKAAQSLALVEWNEIDVAQNPNRAVDVGIVSTPAIAIDGKLVFPSMPTASELRTAIEARAWKD